MIENLNTLLPELFLTISIFVILMIGVFVKDSFNLVFYLSSTVILLTIFIILNTPNDIKKIFLDSFMRDSFSNFFKILILISSFFVLNSSKIFISDNKINKFEYPKNILISIIIIFDSVFFASLEISYLLSLIIGIIIGNVLLKRININRLRNIIFTLAFISSIFLISQA